MVFGTLTTPLALAFILSLVYLIGNRFFKKTEKYHPHIMSLGSGMLITLIILEIFPQIFTSGFASIGSFVFLGLLSGFVGYHLFEKYAYRRRQRVKNLGRLHVIGFGVDNFIDGFILVLFFGLAGIQNVLILLLFVPLLLSNIAEPISLRHLHKGLKLRASTFTLLAFTTVYGAVIGAFLTLNDAQFFFAMSVMTGILLYFVVRDEIPAYPKDRPVFFLVGVIAIALIILSVRMIMPL